MEEVTEARELLDDFFLASKDYENLYYVSITDSFRKDVGELKIDVKKSIVGLVKLALPLWFIKSYVLIFTADRASFGSKYVEKQANSKLRSKTFVISDKLLKEYEESLVSDSEVERLLVKYHLSKSYKRRVKSIVLYDDYPATDEVVTEADKTHNGIKLYKRLKVDYKNPSESYIELRVYADTPVGLINTADIRGLQKVLPTFRKTSLKARQNMLRDSLYHLLRKRGLSHKQANETIMGWGFCGFKDAAEGRKYESRFEKYATDNLAK